MILAALFAAFVLQEEPTFDGESWTHPKEKVKFRVPKDKGYTVVHDREQLKELGDSMLCVGANESQEIMIFLWKETSEEPLEEKAWIEKWEKSWEERLKKQNPDVKKPYSKYGQSKRKSGLTCAEYDVYLKGKEHKALTSYLNRGKELYVFAVLGGTGDNWLRDRDECIPLADGFQGLGNEGASEEEEESKGGDPTFDGESFTHPQYGLRFRVPKDKGYGVLSDRKKLAEKGLDERFLCLGANEPADIMFYLSRETTQNELEVPKFIEAWEESWQKKLDKYRKDGSSTMDNGMTTAEYTIRTKGDEQERKVVVVFHSKGKVHFVFMVLGRSGNDWLKDRDDARAIAGSFDTVKK